jgi:hypothetical protein
MRKVKDWLWSTAVCGAETWRFENYIANVYKGFEMWIWKKLEKISWSDLSRNKEVLHTVREERRILHKIKKEDF